LRFLPMSPRAVRLFQDAVVVRPATAVLQAVSEGAEIRERARLVDRKPPAAKLPGILVGELVAVTHVQVVVAAENQALAIL